ncbi:MAG: hypothetical protein QXF76_01030 [Candidatus Anstonellales archaeon]
MTLLLTYNGTIIALKENDKVYSIANISTLSAKDKQINIIQIQIDNLIYLCMHDSHNIGNFSCNVKQINEILYNKSIEKFFRRLYEKKAIAFEIPLENSSNELIFDYNNISFSCTMIKGELLINRLNDEEKIYYLFQAGMDIEEKNNWDIINKLQYANFTVCLKNNYKTYQSLSAYVRDENNRVILYNSDIFYMNVSNKTDISKEQIIALINKFYLTTT